MKILALPRTGHNRLVGGFSILHMTSDTPRIHSQASLRHRATTPLALRSSSRWTEDSPQIADR